MSNISREIHTRMFLHGFRKFCCRNHLAIATRLHSSCGRGLYCKGELKLFDDDVNIHGISLQCRVRSLHLSAVWLHRHNCRACQGLCQCPSSMHSVSWLSSALFNKFPLMPRLQHFIRYREEYERCRVESGWRVGRNSDERGSTFDKKAPL